MAVFNAAQIAVLKLSWAVDMMTHSPSELIDPNAKGTHYIVREAAKNGFSVWFHPDLGEYQFRHRLGKINFYEPDLIHVYDDDIAVFD